MELYSTLSLTDDLLGDVNKMVQGRLQTLVNKGFLRSIVSEGESLTSVRYVRVDYPSITVATIHHVFHPKNDKE